MDTLAGIYEICRDSSPFNYGPYVILRLLYWTFLWWGSRNRAGWSRTVNRPLSPWNLQVPCLVIATNFGSFLFYFLLFLGGSVSWEKWKVPLHMFLWRQGYLTQCWSASPVEINYSLLQLHQLMKVICCLSFGILSWEINEYERPWKGRLQHRKWRGKMLGG